ncbi:aquaporin-3 [Brachionus plicatilis]|uniref:Aquaporin-3 n=1 Tax=Brachionus plicatilis TaxID=10195 RepID=A0A3M7Q3E1_BRAPC|nr:aquaporin-3 [Brachionus plicatilis]
MEISESNDNHQLNTLENKNSQILIEDNLLKSVDMSDVVKTKQNFNLQESLKKAINITNPLVKEFMAESFGTMIFIFIGCSGVAQFKLNNKQDSNLNNLLSVNIGFGFGVLMAILLVGTISGAHLNPAVSFSLSLTGKMTWRKFFIYSLAQTLGAFLGATLVFLVYLDGLKSFGEEMYSLNTAGIFATYPNEVLGVFGGFLDQVLGTAVLIMVILAISDKKNNDISKEISAILIAFLVIVIGCSLGFNCGYAINPARDFGPRLFTFFAGWGSQVFEAGNGFFWIPIIGPLVGSFIGTLFYLIIVSNNL